MIGIRDNDSDVGIWKQSINNYVGTMTAILLD